MQLNPLKIVLVVFFLGNYIFAQELMTQLEKSHYTSLTGYNSMMEYLEELDKYSPAVSMKIIGKSVEGREIPALFFSSDEQFALKRKNKPKVLIICQQHGNEPSGKEAALILARNLVKEEISVLNYLDLIVVPQVNPDGSEKGTRKNANEMDLNRNYVILSEPESYAIHNLFLDWMPEVTLDLHEFNAIKNNWITAGYIKDADEMLGGITNLNIDPTLLEFSQKIFIPKTGEKIEAEGYRFHRYIVGSPFNNERIRYSTTSITDARQSMGIYNTLSFIIEGKRYGNLTNEIERRTKGQITALISFLNTIAENRVRILELITQVRDHSQHNNSEVNIQMDYFADASQPALKFPVFDLFTWSHTTKELESYYPIVKVKKSVKKPYAYIFSANEKKLVELLKKNRIPLFTLKKDIELKLESYRITHVTSCTDEDKPALCIDTRKIHFSRKFLKGDVIVKMDNQADNLIPLLLEPESSWGIVTDRGAGQYRFKEYLKEDSIYPISRILEEQELQLEESGDNLLLK